MARISPEVLKRIRVKPGTKVRLKDYDTAWTLDADLGHESEAEVKERAQDLLHKNIENLAEAQNLLYASDRFALLIVLQGMDASGKDGTVKHVMSGVNPQGCWVKSFKQPSAEELKHDFLWRYAKSVPERGYIGIFNRSHYEEVLVVRVHPELLEKQNLPLDKTGKRVWEDRYQDINAFERHLSRNGVVILKFFLHLSKREQKQRFLKRLENPKKHWKFSAADLAERAYWSDYVDAYEHAFNATSTSWAPWHIIPADHKWSARVLVAEIITSTIDSLKLEYPQLDPKERRLLAEAKRKLLQE
jgi:PPK2 family polyphosphate:nucleotide phosphotransferase